MTPPMDARGDTLPARAPRWLLEAIRKPKAAEPPRVFVLPPGEYTGGRDGYIAQWVDYLAGMPQGGDGRCEGRAQCLNMAAFACARIPGVDRERLRRELHGACDVNGWRAEEGNQAVEQKIDRAFTDADTKGPYPDKSYEHDGSGTDFDPGVPTEISGADRAEPARGVTWQPIDLGPYLRGEILRPAPSVGVRRSDGLYVIYPGKEHAVIGETECGKTWFALACVAAELAAGHHVLYVHYEESDPGSTIERLRLLGASDDVIAARLRFVGPSEQVRDAWLAELLTPTPRLVVHDGVNEAMALHGAEIAAAEGASEFRRRLIQPCLRAGAATLACDHLPKAKDNHNGRDAFGSVHKGNALDGARFILENTKPFGRHLCGVSHVYVTKDRPGHLRSHGTAVAKTPGKTYFGTLVVDDCADGPDFRAGFYAPSDGGRTRPDEAGDSSEVAEAICAVIADLPAREVESQSKLLAHMRTAGHRFRKTAVTEALTDAVVTGRLRERPGRRGSMGYQLINRPVPSEGDSDA